MFRNGDIVTLLEYRYVLTCFIWSINEHLLKFGAHPLASIFIYFKIILQFWGPKLGFVPLNRFLLEALVAGTHDICH